MRRIWRDCASATWKRGKSTAESGTNHANESVNHVPRKRGRWVALAERGSGLPGVAPAGRQIGSCGRPISGRIGRRGETMLPLHLQPQSHVPLYIQLRDQLRSLVHAGDLRPGDRIPASRELATMLGVHRTTVANAYAELESEGLIQGHVGRGTFIRGDGGGLKITPPAPPVLNGNGGIRWELLFADERGEEVLSRLTANVPENALSFVMARPAEEFFPIEELQACVNAVLRREGAEVLNLGPSDGYPPLKEALLEMLHHDGFAAQITGVGRAPPGSGRGRSHLCAAACAGRAHPFVEAARPFEPGHSHRQLCKGGISGLASGMDRCSGDSD